MKTFRIYTREIWENTYIVDAESEEQARAFVMKGCDTFNEGFENCDHKQLEAFQVECEVTQAWEEADYTGE